MALIILSFSCRSRRGRTLAKGHFRALPQCRFLPHRRHIPGNYNEYLQLPNVACVGGSWLAPQTVVMEKNWAKVTELAKKALADVNRV